MESTLREGSKYMGYGRGVRVRHSGGRVPQEPEERYYLMQLLLVVVIRGFWGIRHVENYSLSQRAG